MNNTLALGDALLIGALMFIAYQVGVYAERADRRHRARDRARDYRDGLDPARNYSKRDRKPYTRNHYN